MNKENEFSAIGCNAKPEPGRFLVTSDLIDKELKKRDVVFATGYCPVIRRKVNVSVEVVNGIPISVVCTEESCTNHRSNQETD